MKKTFTIITLLAGAVSGYSQGNIAFNDYTTSLKAAIFNTQSTQGNYTATYGGYTTTELQGNSPASSVTGFAHENPAGTTVYASGSILSGTGYSSEILVGPAGITTLGGTVMENGSPVGLLPFGGPGNNGVVVGFHTGAANIGLPNSVAAVVLPTQTYYAQGLDVSVAIAAWNNEGGTLTTLAEAQSAGAAWGIDSPQQSSGLTVPASAPTPLPSTLESFSLGSVPEPSTIALGVMGISTLLFRRKK